MFKLFKTFDNTKTLEIAKKTVTTVNLMENETSMYSEQELRDEIWKLKKFAKENKDLDPILPRTFALVRETSKRLIGLRHYDTQLMGGYCLEKNKIAEMKTGEGKTLVATLPLTLNALGGQGSHLVTVNDYLAKRDAETMGKIYNFLGLSVGLIQENMQSPQRRKNYNADITYVTNSELAFDYLRDNMETSLENLVQRPYNYCIVDEVDSILIDEARTPLIISEPQDIPIEKYIIADETTRYLRPKAHYIVDEKNKTVRLTNQGILQIEKILETTNLYDPTNPWIPYIINAIKARTLFLKETNYIVKNNEILIIDEFTGRIMPERRWSEGLHQAIEAKERVTVKQGSETLGSITYQNFFRLYPKLAGMTGTAKTAEAELKKIYNLEVVVIPTEKPIKRKDLNDLVYQDEYTKWKKIALKTARLHSKGQPVLIGTISIEKSEIISQLLADMDIPHQLLNAKPENIEKEADIIAQAGSYKTVTVATNMAGRGTDILLGGNPIFRTQKQLRKLLENLSSSKGNKLSTLIFYLERKTKTINITELEKLIYIIKQLENHEIQIFLAQLAETESFPYVDKYLKSIVKNLNDINQKCCNNEKERIKKLGGLYIIGTERHESKRIDNQLRGRAGRQGDPGTSQFFLSLDDDLLRVFGGEKIKSIMTNFNLDEEAIESGTLTQTIDNAQSRVEDFFYDTRKQLFEYDEVLNIQRLTIFRERRAILEFKSVRSEIINYGETLMTNFEQKLHKNRSQKTKIESEIKYILNMPFLQINTFNTNLQNLLWISYDLKENEFESYNLGLIRLLEKDILLREIDKNWKKHLQDVELLKDSIRWRGYGQFDPLTEYKRESYNLFVETIYNIKYNTFYNLMKARFH